MTGGTLHTWLRVWRQQARRRRAAEGPWSDLAAAVGPLLLAVVIRPLIQPVFLGFLRLDATHLAEGTAGLLLRLVILVAGWTALEAHQVVLRTGDRAVLTSLPVEPSAVVAYELLRLAVRRWWMVPCFGMLLAPLAAVAPGLWFASVGVLAVVQFAALPAGAVGALLAIEASESPSWVPVLDLLRGQNPRVQASLVWAPGVVLALLGGAGALAAFGAIAAVGGAHAQAGFGLLPLGLAAACALWLPRLARRAWFRGTPLLGEIAARYSAIERPEDAGRVYLDWGVRFLPVPLRTWALADLRHGWRARRGWISATWAGGAAAGLAGWSGDAASVALAAAVGCAAIWGCGSVSGWMERDIPPYTRMILPDRTTARFSARAVVLFAWLQPVAWIPTPLVATRHGLGTSLGLFAWIELSIVAVALLAPTLARVGIGLVGYVPTAVLAAGAAASAGSRLWGTP